MLLDLVLKFQKYYENLDLNHFGHSGHDVSSKIDVIKINLISDRGQGCHGGFYNFQINLDNS